MTLQLYNTTRQAIPEEQLSRAVLLVLGKEGFSVESVSGIYCGNRMIRKINREFLQHDYPTDTITFRYNKGPEIDGEFYISIDVVRENAARFNVDFQQELLRVTLHSALHLAGIDDRTDRERHDMQEKEAFYLDLLQQST
ncbi:MAG: rRNA maturation RNase YbeY [Chlorobiaceae bacterium]|nr:rRNA maturation RNase YbeY [Chlorobiaceae bacterium]NTV60810.1 rRNA maturation RNase YbeY [Chlorobiaceae bacterium]